MLRKIFLNTKSSLWLKNTAPKPIRSRQPFLMVTSFSLSTSIVAQVSNQLKTKPVDMLINPRYQTFKNGQLVGFTKIHPKNPKKCGGGNGPNLFAELFHAKSGNERCRFLKTRPGLRVG